jgi:3-deoxy-7-phosphoheptulonate synthase
MNSIAAAPIAGYRLFPSPGDVRRELPLPATVTANVAAARAAVRAVLDHADDRLMVITTADGLPGPDAELRYAARLASAGLDDDLLIILLTAAVAPATLAGIPGGGAGGSAARSGIRAAREQLACLAGLLPAAARWDCPVTAHYLADLVSWGLLSTWATGSQAHHDLASGLAMPAGFNTGPAGANAAAEAAADAGRPHMFFGVSSSGRVAIVRSHGNAYCHLVLRCGTRGPVGPLVTRVAGIITAAGLPGRLIIDTSQPGRRGTRVSQPDIAAAVAEQITAGEYAIAGVLLPGSPSGSRPGAGMRVLETLATAVRQRRQRNGNAAGHAC